MSSILQKVGNVAASVAALYVLYQLYVWKRYDDLIRRSGLKMLPLESDSLWRRPLGNFIRHARNWARTYDQKLDNFKSMGGALTIGIPAPFWSPEPIVNSADPAVIRHILKDKFDVYIKPWSMIKCLHVVLGDGIFGINHGPHAADGGASWNLQRKTASKVFTNNNFKTLMYETFSKHAEKVVKVIEKQIREGENGGVVEVQKLMYKYTLDSIGVIGFGVDIDSLSNEEVGFANSFDKAQMISAYRFVTPFWDVPLLGKLLYKNEREIDSHVKVMNEFVFDIISKRKDEIAKGVGASGDILTLFLQEKLGLTDKELKDVVMSFIIAGRDTTASTLSFAMMLLAENPEWQERLRAEVKAMLDSKNDKKRILDSNDISKMKLLQNVVMETLRLYPPVPIDVKAAATDDVLPGGYKICKGTRISFEPYVMGRLEQFWGPDCEVFNPDRWLKHSTLPSPYEFPVFQAGPRICLGESLAKFEASLLIGALLDHFQFSKINPEDRFTYMPGITLSIKGGLHLRVKKLHG